MRSRHVAGACLAGFAATFALVAPAYAAAPTLSGPASRTGFGPVTLSGKADANATVQLFETAQVFNDFEPAEDWDTGLPLTTKADDKGNYSLQRPLDSGFFFYVEANGVKSNTITVDIKQLPQLTISSPSAGTVNATIYADPAQPGLAAELQLKNGDSWESVDKGNVLEVTEDGHHRARFDAVATKLPAGTLTFRAYVGGDPSNGVLAGTSETRSINANGSGTQTPPTTPPTTKPPVTPPTTKPPVTPPTTKPPTTKPTPKPTPKPTAPKAGSVKFTKVLINPAGTDTGKNAHLNKEYVVLKNTTKSSINLKNWKVRDKAGHVYKFTGNFYLKAGKTVTIHTGKGKNTAAHRYWNRKGKGGYIWNNAGDTAYVRSYTGATIDTCKWGKGRVSTSC